MKLSKIISLTAVLLYTATFTSCVKDEVDEPPAFGTDPAITVNKTIAQLKALYTGTFMQIDSNYVIKGVVVGDDHSGNFYKSIVIQDSTGGINIQLDQSGFYTSYKVGRNVFVKCRGLVLGDYNGLVQLGGYIDNSSPTPAVGRIPQSLISNHLIGGAWNQPYATKIVYNFSTDLSNTADQNKLVRLEGVHFADPCLTWADLVGQTSGNRDLIDAYGNTVTVRTSNFASFAAQLIPGSTGDVIGVFQIYGSTKQLVIREVSDVIMAPAACNTGPVGTGGLMSIAGVRALFSGGNGNVFVAGTKVRGTVISDRSTANLNSYNMILQDGTGGIMVRFLATNTLNLNDSVEIDLSGDSLISYQQGIEINKVPNANATVLGSGSVSPNVVTATYVLSHVTSLESTLIKINGATLSGGTGGTFSGSVNVNDGTGAVIMYTRSGATFATTPYPASVTVSVIGYISNFNGTPEIVIRDVSDIQ